MTRLDLLLLSLNGIQLLLGAAFAHDCVPKSPWPSDATCGVTGSAQGRPIYDYIPVSDDALVEDLAACVELCQSLQLIGWDRPGPACTWLYYNTNTSVCSIRTDDTAGNHMTSDPRSPQIFYDISCFSCPKSCDYPLGKNILGNGGFESSPSYLGPWLTGPDYNKTAPGQNSPTAFICPPEQFPACGLIQARNRCHATDLFLLEFDYRIEPNENYDARFGLIEPTGPHAGPSEAFLVSTNVSVPWRTVRTLTRFTGMGIRMEQSSGWSATYWLDNFVQTRIAPLVPVSGAASLFENGCFEERGDGLTPWLFHAVDATYGESSTPVGRCSTSLNVTTVSTAEDFLLEFRQFVRTAPGGKYLLSFTALQPVSHFYGIQFVFGVHSDEFEVIGRLFNDTSSEAAVTIMLLSLEPGREERFEVPFVANYEVTPITLRIQGAGPGGPNPVQDSFSTFLSDFQVLPVEEVEEAEDVWEETEGEKDAKERYLEPLGQWPMNGK